jgi:hypothetical protein
MNLIELHFYSFYLFIYYYVHNESVLRKTKFHFSFMQCGGYV